MRLRKRDRADNSRGKLALRITRRASECSASWNSSCLLYELAFAPPRPKFLTVAEIFLCPNFSCSKLGQGCSTPQSNSAAVRESPTHATVNFPISGYAGEIARRPGCARLRWGGMKQKVHTRPHTILCTDYYLVLRTTGRRTKVFFLASWESTNGKKMPTLSPVAPYLYIIRYTHVRTGLLCTYHRVP